MVRSIVAAGCWLLTSNAFIVTPPTGSLPSVNRRDAVDREPRAAAKGPLYGIPFERDPQFDEYGLPVEPKTYTQRDGPDFKVSCHILLKRHVCTLGSVHLQSTC